MASVRIRRLLGDTIKFKIDWEYPSDQTVTLDGIDFWVGFKASKSVTFAKEDLYYDEVGEDPGWYCYLDTNLVGTGSLSVRIRAHVPDIRCEQGYKVDQAEADTLVYIYV